MWYCCVCWLCPLLPLHIKLLHLNFMYVFMFWVPCHDLCYDFHVNTMFESSWLPFVLYVLFILLLFICAYWCSTPFRSLVHCLFFFYWPLNCLYFDLRILITPLISSKFHSFPVVDWFCLFIWLWVWTFPTSCLRGNRSRDHDMELKTWKHTWNLNVAVL
jgi:hypothetical protein